jgi:hypothetical protein
VVVTFIFAAAVDGVLSSRPFGVSVMREAPTCRRGDAFHGAFVVEGLVAVCAVGSKDVHGDCGEDGRWRNVSLQGVPVNTIYGSSDSFACSGCDQVQCFGKGLPYSWSCYGLEV